MRLSTNTFQSLSHSYREALQLQYEQQSFLDILIDIYGPIAGLFMSKSLFVQWKEECDRLQDDAPEVEPSLSFNSIEEMNLSQAKTSIAPEDWCSDASYSGSDDEVENPREKNAPSVPACRQLLSLLFRHIATLCQSVPDFDKKIILSLWTRALLYDRNDIDLYVKCGQAAIQYHRWLLAHWCYERSLSMGSISAHAHLCLISYQLGDLVKASNHLQFVKSNDPFWSKVRQQLEGEIQGTPLSAAVLTKIPTKLNSTWKSDILQLTITSTCSFSNKLLELWHRFATVDPMFLSLIKVQIHWQEAAPSLDQEDIVPTPDPESVEASPAKKTRVEIVDETRRSQRVLRESSQSVANATEQPAQVDIFQVMQSFLPLEMQVTPTSLVETMDPSTMQQDSAVIQDIMQRAVSLQQGKWTRKRSQIFQADTSLNPSPLTLWPAGLEIKISEANNWNAKEWLASLGDSVSVWTLLTSFTFLGPQIPDYHESFVELVQSMNLLHDAAWQQALAGKEAKLTHLIRMALTVCEWHWNDRLIAWLHVAVESLNAENGNEFLVRLLWIKASHAQQENQLSVALQIYQQLLEIMEKDLYVPYWSMICLERSHVHARYEAIQSQIFLQDLERHYAEGHYEAVIQGLLPLFQASTTGPASLPISIRGYWLACGFQKRLQLLEVLCNAYVYLEQSSMIWEMLLIHFQWLSTALFFDPTRNGVEQLTALLQKMLDHSHVEMKLGVVYQKLSVVLWCVAMSLLNESRITLVNQSSTLIPYLRLFVVRVLVWQSRLLNEKDCIAYLKAMHEILGKRHLCDTDQGLLLKHLLQYGIDSQAVYCLYGVELSPIEIEKHGSNLQVSLDRQLAEQLFALIRIRKGLDTGMAALDRLLDTVSNEKQLPRVQIHLQLWRQWLARPIDLSQIHYTDREQRLPLFLPLKHFSPLNDIYFMKAQLLFEQEKYVECVDSLLIVIAMNPNHLEAVSLLGQCYWYCSEKSSNNNELEKSFWCFKFVLHHHMDEKALFFCGKLLLELTSKSVGYNVFTLNGKKCSLDTTAVRHLCISAAARCFQQLTKTSEICHLLGRCAQKMPRGSLASHHFYKQSLALDSNSLIVQYKFWTLLSKRMLSLGTDKVARALQCVETSEDALKRRLILSFQSLLERESDFHPAVYRIARLQFSLGQLKEAQETMETLFNKQKSLIILEQLPHERVGKQAVYVEKYVRFMLEILTLSRNEEFIWLFCKRLHTSNLNIPAFHSLLSNGLKSCLSLIQNLSLDDMTSAMEQSDSLPRAFTEASLNKLYRMTRDEVPVATIEGRYRSIYELWKMVEQGRLSVGIAELDLKAFVEKCAIAWQKELEKEDESDGTDND